MACKKAGVHKVAVQAALRMNLQCTFASWIQLSPTQKDALYVQALQILRTLSEFLKVCVTDLEQLAAEYKDAGNDAAAEEMLQQLTSVLHPQYSSEDELEEVKCEQEDSAAAQQVLLGGGSSNSGGGGNAPQKRGAADEQPVMAPASARDRFTLHSLKKMGMRGAWTGTADAEQRNISKIGLISHTITQAAAAVSGQCAKVYTHAHACSVQYLLYHTYKDIWYEEVEG